MEVSSMGRYGCKHDTCVFGGAKISFLIKGLPILEYKSYFNTISDNKNIPVPIKQKISRNKVQQRTKSGMNQNVALNTPFISHCLTGCCQDTFQWPLPSRGARGGHCKEVKVCTVHQAQKSGHRREVAVFGGLTIAFLLDITKKYIFQINQKHHY